MWNYIVKLLWVIPKQPKNKTCLKMWQFQNLIYKLYDVPNISRIITPEFNTRVGRKLTVRGVQEGECNETADKIKLHFFFSVFILLN